MYFNGLIPTYIKCACSTNQSACFHPIKHVYPDKNVLLLCHLSKVIKIACYSRQILKLFLCNNCIINKSLPNVQVCINSGINLGKNNDLIQLVKLLKQKLFVKLKNVSDKKFGLVIFTF
jgi:hypothetical protein